MRRVGLDISDVDVRSRSAIPSYLGVVFGKEKQKHELDERTVRGMTLRASVSVDSL